MLKTQVTPWRVLFGLFLITLVVAVPVQAGSLATMHFGGSVVSWEPLVRYDQAVLTVSGPAGVVSYAFTANEMPFLDLASLEGPIDGSYTFELRLVPLLQPEVREMLQAARLQGDAQAERDMRTQGLLPSEPLVQSGYLIAQGGQFVVPGGEEEPTGALQPRTAGDSGLASASAESLRNVSGADQVILDDLIVDGSACVGFDCVNGESFGFDTLRLKENNVRIKFDDTSNSASFPFVDWQLTANDSANGGANKFSIDDITNGRTPFTIEAGAPSHSLYVDDGGRIGLGTSTPVVELQIVDGDTPTLRLQQDGSSGFQAQTWDVAGNETNFFVRDVTNGSELPFRILPGADKDALTIEGDNDILMKLGSLHIPAGRIGIGTTSPNSSTSIHIVAAGTLRYRLENSSAATSWDAVNDGNGDFAISLLGSGANELEIEQDGDIGNCGNPDHDFVISTGPGCTATPRSWIDAGDAGFSVSSSRSYKENLKALEVPDLLDKIRNVRVYHYDFIDGPEDRIGLMAEDFHEIFNRGSDKELSGHDMQLALWMAVQELIDQNKQLRQEVDELKSTE